MYNISTHFAVFNKTSRIAQPIFAAMCIMNLVVQLSDIAHRDGRPYSKFEASVLIGPDTIEHHPLRSKFEP